MADVTSVVFIGEKLLVFGEGKDLAVAVDTRCCCDGMFVLMICYEIVLPCTMADDRIRRHIPRRLVAVPNVDSNDSPGYEDIVLVLDEKAPVKGTNFNYMGFACVTRDQVAPGLEYVIFPSYDVYIDDKKDPNNLIETIYPGKHCHGYYGMVEEAYSPAAEYAYACPVKKGASTGDLEGRKGCYLPMGTSDGVTYTVVGVTHCAYGSYTMMLHTYRVTAMFACVFPAYSRVSTSQSLRLKICGESTKTVSIAQSMDDPGDDDQPDDTFYITQPKYGSSITGNLYTNSFTVTNGYALSIAPTPCYDDAGNPIPCSDSNDIDNYMIPSETSFTLSLENTFSGSLYVHMIGCECCPPPDSDVKVSWSISGPDGVVEGEEILRRGEVSKMDVWFRTYATLEACYASGSATIAFVDDDGEEIPWELGPGGRCSWSRSSAIYFSLPDPSNDSPGMMVAEFVCGKSRTEISLELVGCDCACRLSDSEWNDVFRELDGMEAKVSYTCEGTSETVDGMLQGGFIVAWVCCNGLPEINGVHIPSLGSFEYDGMSFTSSLGDNGIVVLCPTMNLKIFVHLMDGMSHSLDYCVPDTVKVIATGLDVDGNEIRKEVDLLYNSTDCVYEGNVNKISYCEYTPSVEPAVCIPEPDEDDEGGDANSNDDSNDCDYDDETIKYKYFAVFEISSVSCETDPDTDKTFFVANGVFQPQAAHLHISLKYDDRWVTPYCMLEDPDSNDMYNSNDDFPPSRFAKTTFTIPQFGVKDPEPIQFDMLPGENATLEGCFALPSNASYSEMARTLCQYVCQVGVDDPGSEGCSFWASIPHNRYYVDEFPDCVLHDDTVDMTVTARCHHGDKGWGRIAICYGTGGSVRSRGDGGNESEGWFYLEAPVGTDLRNMIPEFTNPYSSKYRFSSDGHLSGMPAYMPDTAGYSFSVEGGPSFEDTMVGILDWHIVVDTTFHASIDSSLFSDWGAPRSIQVTSPIAINCQLQGTYGSYHNEFKWHGIGDEWVSSISMLYEGRDNFDAYATGRAYFTKCKALSYNSDERMCVKNEEDEYEVRPFSEWNELARKFSPISAFLFEQTGALTYTGGKMEVDSYLSLSHVPLVFSFAPLNIDMETPCLKEMRYQVESSPSNYFFVIGAFSGTLTMVTESPVTQEDGLPIKARNSGRANLCDPYISGDAKDPDGVSPAGGYSNVEVTMYSDSFMVDCSPNGRCRQGG